MPAIRCPSCGRKLRVADHMAGRKVICPGCADTVEAPPPPEADDPVLAAAGGAPRAETAPAPEAVALPLYARLGMTAMALGVGAVAVLCLPFVGYVSIPMSGVGLLLGLGGLFSAHGEGGEGLDHSPAGGAGFWQRFGTRARDYPLAGITACVLSLTLALLPFLFH